MGKSWGGGRSERVGKERDGCEGEGRYGERERRVGLGEEKKEDRTGEEGNKTRREGIKRQVWEGERLQMDRGGARGERVKKEMR